MRAARGLLGAGLALLVIAAICAVSPVSTALAQGPGAPTAIACGTALRDSDQYRALRTAGSPPTSNLPYTFMSFAQYQTVSTCQAGLLTMRIAASAMLVLGSACTAVALIRRQRTRRPRGT